MILPLCCYTRLFYVQGRGYWNLIYVSVGWDLLSDICTREDMRGGNYWAPTAITPKLQLQLVEEGSRLDA